MSITLTVNGTPYEYPESGDTDWGADATDWAAAVTTGMLQKSGGLFQLLAEVDFGTAYGLKSLYYKSRTANVASAGQVRLARADVISWRNQANSADLDLSVNASDALLFNGTALQGVISVSDTATIDLTLTGATLSADIVALSITNALISNSAAIAYGKLALTGSIVNADLANMATLTIKGNSTGGPAAPSDLSVTTVTSMLNAFVGDSGSGGTKGLVPAPASGDSAAQKFLKADGTWTTPPGSGDVVGPASSTDSGFARFDGLTGKLLKNSAATLVNADIANNAAIAYSKLAALTVSRALVSDVSGVVTVATTTATELGYVNGVTSSIQPQIDGKEPTITLLPLSKGGTNKNLTPAAGGVVYTDADSMEVTAAGTAGQVIISAGSSAPAWGTDVLGVATNSNAAAGYKGEFLTASLASGSATALTSNTAKTVISQSLTAGDWDVTGWVGFTDASGTTTTNVSASISQTNNAQGSQPATLIYPTGTQLNTAGSGSVRLPTNATRVSIASTTTVYLVAYSLFGASTMSAFGTINCRRVR